MGRDGTGREGRKRGRYGREVVHSLFVSQFNCTNFNYGYYIIMCSTRISCFCHATNWSLVFVRETCLRDRLSSARIDMWKKCIRPKWPPPNGSWSQTSKSIGQEQCWMNEYEKDLMINHRTRRAVKPLALTTTRNKQCRWINKQRNEREDGWMDE